MPSIKDFEKKEKTNAKPVTTESETKVSAAKKRRPGRDPETASQEEVKVVDVETGKTHFVNEKETTMDSQQTNNQTETETAQNPTPRVEIKFPGSEILRAKFAKAFEVGESIATDWVHDGNFEALPLGHPLAQYFAAKGLQKAKRAEKKVLESPMTEKVAMQALQAGMKAQEIINQARAKFKK